MTKWKILKWCFAPINEQNKDFFPHLLSISLIYKCGYHTFHKKLLFNSTWYQHLFWSSMFKNQVIITLQQPMYKSTLLSYLATNPFIILFTNMSFSFAEIKWLNQSSTTEVNLKNISKMNLEYYIYANDLNQWKAYSCQKNEMSVWKLKYLFHIFWSTKLVIFEKKIYIILYI